VRGHHARETALALASDYHLIVHEHLQIGNMTARPRPRPDGSGGYRSNQAHTDVSAARNILRAGLAHREA